MKVMNQTFYKTISWEMKVNQTLIHNPNCIKLEEIGAILILNTLIWEHSITSTLETMNKRLGIYKMLAQTKT